MNRERLEETATVTHRKSSPGSVNRERPKETATIIHRKSSPGSVNRERPRRQPTLDTQDTKEASGAAAAE